MMDCANCKEEGKGIILYIWPATDEKRYYCENCHLELMQTLVRDYRFLHEIETIPLARV
jgi:hypothetical protein